MMRVLEKVWKSWDEFFFAPLSLWPAALFRIVFALNLIAMNLTRFMDWKFYFTDRGLIPAALAKEALPEFFRPAFFWFPVSDTAVWWCCVAILAALIFLLLGVASRAMSLIALIIHLALMQRNPAIVYGADIVTSFFLFALVFIDSGRHLSLFYVRTRLSATADLFSTVGVRLLQIQLCLIYGYTGLEKLKGPTWWDGTAVWSVLGNQQIMLFDFSFMKQMPLAIALMTLGTVFWEVYFPALVWIRPLRKWVLVIGVLLHAMIALTVGLVFFSLAMTSVYLIFLDGDWVRIRVRRLPSFK